MEPGLEITRFYDPYFGTASNATHVAVVEVDQDTYAKLKSSVISSSKTVGVLSIHSSLTAKSVAELPRALAQPCTKRWSMTKSGQLLTGSLVDYLVPTASELLPIEVHHIETPSPTTLGGFRGMGEGGTIGAPAALANAVSDALSPLGIEINELPITPERLFQLVRAAKKIDPRRWSGLNDCSDCEICSTLLQCSLHFRHARKGG